MWSIEFHSPEAETALAAHPTDMEIIQKVLLGHFLEREVAAVRRGGRRREFRMTVIWTRFLGGETINLGCIWKPSKQTLRVFEPGVLTRFDAWIKLSRWFGRSGGSIEVVCHFGILASRVWEAKLDASFSVVQSKLVLIS